LAVPAIPVFLEIGKRWTFASSLEWPGWSRRGADAEAALETLVAYGPRYRAALGPAGRGLSLPRAVGALVVSEQMAGDASTDFGVPAAVPAADERPLTAAELRRQLRILEACWAAFDAAGESVAGVQLRTGPRGGGRDLEKMRAHLADGDRGYLGRVGGRVGRDEAGDLQALRSAFVAAVTARARGEVPDRGPRGGRRWPARYAIRRSAWHALDHAWELEDRSGP
jgi:hypothetical protein